MKQKQDVAICRLNSETNSVILAQDLNYNQSYNSNVQHLILSYLGYFFTLILIIWDTLIMCNN